MCDQFLCARDTNDNFEVSISNDLSGDLNVDYYNIVNTFICGIFMLQYKIPPNISKHLANFCKEDVCLANNSS